MKASSLLKFPVCLVSAVVAAGCSQTQYNRYMEQAGGYFHAAEVRVSRAVTRAADALGILPRTEAMIARTNVNVRTGPGTNYQAIGALAAGEPVPVVDEKNGWYWIRYRNGHAWVKSSYVVAGTPASATAATVAATATARDTPFDGVRSGDASAKSVSAANKPAGRTAAEEKILAAENPATTEAPPASEVAALGPAKPVVVREIGGYDVLTPAEVEENPTTSLRESAAPTTTLEREPSVARLDADQADQTDAMTEGDPASVPGDAAASAVPVTDDGMNAPTQVVDASALGGDVEVAGITFHWGMSPSAAAAQYTNRARRVEANGAVWLQAADVGSGVNLPVEWFDLRYCGNRLCAIHHVVNDVQGDKKLGDQIASTFDARNGAPTADFWTDFGYGRLRMRTWRTPSTRIRLSHQEAQTYVAIDYEPIGSSRPVHNEGTLARD